MSKPVPPEDRTPKCAQCRKKPVSAEYRPFCSKRCADVDLGKWLNEGYAIPGAPAEEDGSAAVPDGSGEMSADD
ncbi:MAG: DNA gyrase inhibitor YacG [Hyphomonas sp.]|nr:DNA gyrase inhibitor YacG [Hyphomonas sp.]